MSALPPIADMQRTQSASAKCRLPTLYQSCCLDPLRLSFQSFHRYGIALCNELIDARA
jgi:hypothetical protein